MVDFTPRISQAEAEELVVGRRLDEAVKRADEAGFDVRVVRQDGSGRPRRMDRRTNRINVATEAGVVVAVTGLS
jgi:hypothetical protein